MSLESANHPENSPKVSVIMNCLNCEKYLREAIDSVYAQTFKDWEIIFWDNASKDKSAEIAKSYDERLRYFENNKTVLLGEARNLAIQQSRGEYIAFLDCDDLWLPKKLEKQIPIFDKNPKVGLVVCDTIFFNKHGDVKQLYAKKKPPTGDVFRYLLTHYFISMETAVLRRQALDSLDEWFDIRFDIIEEADLFTRIAYKWDIDYVDEPLAKWRMHLSSFTFSRKELFPQEKELMLSKFCKTYNGFKEEYKNEINIIKSQIAIEYATMDWENGEKTKARKRLMPYLKLSRKCKLIYLLTFFPFMFYRQLYKLMGIKPL